MVMPANCNVLPVNTIGRGPKRRFELVKTFATTEFANGQDVRVDFSNLATRDEVGRYVHLVGIRFVVAFQYDVVAASLAGAVPGYWLLTKLSNMTLQANGHNYIEMIDGADLRDDTMFRDFRLQPDPTAIADSDATNAAQTVIFDYYFGPSESIPGRDMDFALPLALLDTRDDPNAVLKFRMAALSATGLTDDGATSLKVYAITQGEEAGPVVGPRWKIELYSSSLTNYSLPSEPGEKIHYAVIRPRPAAITTAFTDYVSTGYYTNINAFLGAQQMFGGTRSWQEIAHGWQAIYRQASSWPASNAAVTTEQQSMYRTTRLLETEFLPLILTPQWAGVSHMAEGPLRLNFGRATDTETRVLLRRIFPSESIDRIKVACKHGIPVDDVIREVNRAKPLDPSSASSVIKAMSTDPNLLPQTIVDKSRIADLNLLKAPT